MPKKVTKTIPTPVKRGPGRPRKEMAPEPVVEAKRKPGRPRKVVTTAPEPVVMTKVAKVPRVKKTTTIVPNGKPPKAGTKTEMIYKMLTRTKGCTRPEVLDAVKWPSISMQHTAGLLGLKLRQEKTEAGTRYYGSP